MSTSAIVKSVTSGDTLVVRGPPGPKGEAPKERVLHLAEITAPRIGSATREDEAFAYESREFLRAYAVGKQIHFNVTHALGPSNDGGQRDIGVAMVGGADLATEILKNGWARLKEGKRDESEEDHKRKELEAKAKEEGKGLWNPEGPADRTVNYSMPADPFAFLTEWKGKPIESLVEQVRDGDHVRIRLILSDTLHQFINLSIAGIRSPRSSPKESEPAEEWGNEAKFFTESRLLHRHVRVTLLSLPSPSASPFSATNMQPPTPPSYFIGLVIHPVGNIAEFLIQAGLARIVDWHAGMLSSIGVMERLRAAEKVAREKQLGLYKTATAPGSKGNGHIAKADSRDFDGHVIRVWTGDQISILDKDTSKERRAQLSSVRAPRANDPKQAHYANEAREFLRKRLIGKHVRAHVDYIRPPEGEYEERECVTIRIGGGNTNVAEQLIEKGLATAMRHRRDDENRSPDYDKFMAAEQAAVAAGRGLHSGKEEPLSRIGNASETHAKALQFLSGFKRAGRIPAVVEYVAAGSRFKLFIPKENQTLTLVLAGIRAPRTARNPSETSEPFGAEALEFANRRFMQRDVEVEFESVDKSGGFIGTMYVNKTENAAIALVREGLGQVHAYSADSLPWASQLYDTETQAKKEKKNLWANYTEDAPPKLAQDESSGDGAVAKPEYLDVIVSDIRTDSSGVTFSVQILQDGGIAALEKLMSDFAIHNRTASSAPGFAPRKGDLVSAKFSGDGAWYRAKIMKANPVKKEAEVTFIDYGNQETVQFPQMRPIDAKFKSLPPQAIDARLSFVKLAGGETEYGDEALQRFRTLCESRKLIAITDYREGPVLHLRLIDATSTASLNDPMACINVDLVREGLATLDKGVKYLASNSSVVRGLTSAADEARRERLGIYEYGDVSED